MPLQSLSPTAGGLILQGAKPSDIPFEQARHFELLVT
jgi:hypothetical protein